MTLDDMDAPNRRRPPLRDISNVDQHSNVSPVPVSSENLTPFGSRWERVNLAKQLRACKRTEQMVVSPNLHDITNIDQLSKGGPGIVHQGHGPSTINITPLTDANISPLSNLIDSSNVKSDNVRQEHSPRMGSVPEPSTSLFIHDSTTNMTSLNDANICSLSNLTDVPNSKSDNVHQEHLRCMESVREPSSAIFIHEETIPSTTNMSSLTNGINCTLGNLTFASDDGPATTRERVAEHKKVLSKEQRDTKNAQRRAAYKKKKEGEGYSVDALTQE